ncbi:MAG: hypothetical protein ACI8RD_009968, partial [Bacillariaceae sp.]
MNQQHNHPPNQNGGLLTTVVQYKSSTMCMDRKLNARTIT